MVSAESLQEYSPALSYHNFPNLDRTLNLDHCPLARAASIVSFGKYGYGPHDEWGKLRWVSKLNGGRETPTETRG